MWLYPEQLAASGNGCDFSIVGFCVWLSILTLGKLLLFIFHALSWKKRHYNILRDQRRLSVKVSRQMMEWEKTRIPLIPIASAVGFIAYFIAVIIVPLNIANTHNGIPFVLFGFGYLALLFQIALYWIKVMKLAASVS